MRFFLPEIRHDQASFEALASLHAQTKEYILDDVEINMNATRWFDADMCAAFGAVLYSLGERLNRVNLICIRPAVERILSKNGFLSHYGQSDYKFLTSGERPFLINGLMLKTTTISLTILKMSLYIVPRYLECRGDC